MSFYDLVLFGDNSADSFCISFLASCPQHDLIFSGIYYYMIFDLNNGPSQYVNDLKSLKLQTRIYIGNPDIFYT